MINIAALLWQCGGHDDADITSLSVLDTEIV